MKREHSAPMMLIVGSTGLLGCQIARCARRDGVPVRALARPTAAPERLQALRECGAELRWGDLKSIESLESACRDVSALISTASSTLSRQQGDDIESVDRHGQIALVEVAKAAGVEHCTFFGLGPQFGESPLAAAKRAFEQSVQESGMRWTNLIGNFFMEVWLSPALGFDHSSRRVTYFGTGRARSSWVSYRDVAEAAARAHRTTSAANRSFEACGPERLSQREVVRLFESILGQRFGTREVPEDVLARQAQAAPDPLQRTFAALQLACARGVVMDPKPFRETFDLKLNSVSDYVERVLGRKQQENDAAD
jgi:uncharacterized protein YbjT (DUF2867 family)